MHSGNMHVTGISLCITKRHFMFRCSYDNRSSGVHDIAPRESVDFVYEGQAHVIPGAHPLPLYNPDNTVTRPLVSPYLPSPQRPHPYFT